MINISIQCFNVVFVLRMSSDNIVLEVYVGSLLSLDLGVAAH